MLLNGIALGIILADVIAAGQVDVRNYCTILTTGIHVRFRVRGRLHAIDCWREHRGRDR